MIRTNFFGRLGNVLLQNIGTSIISKKFNIKVNRYYDIENIEIFKLSLFNSDRILNDFIEV